MATYPTRWGALLCNNDLGSLGSLPHENVSTFREVQLSINQISENPASATYSTLENLLSVTQFPADLADIDGAHLAALCIKLMRVYVEKNKLFDHIYGLRCVQLLSLALQLDILRCSGWLGRPGSLPTQLGPQEIEFLLANSAARLAFMVRPESAQLHYRVWSAGFTANDRHFLFLALWNARKELLHVCGHVPGIQGWIIIFTVIWLPLVHNPSEMSAEVYYRLKDLACRYSLAAKDDRTYVVVHLMIDWIHDELLRQGRNSPTDPYSFNPEDIREMPILRDILTERLTRTGKDCVNPHLASTLIEFFINYHLRSPDSLLMATEFQLFVEAIFKRLWIQVEDEGCLLSMRNRVDVADLTFTFLRIMIVPFSGPDIARLQNGAVSGANISSCSRIFAGALHNVDWICLLGRLLLMPTLPLNGQPVSAIEYGTIKNYWKSTLEQIRVHCISMSRYDQSAFSILSTSFSDWWKTFDFIRLQLTQGQLHPVIKEHLENTKEIWENIGGALVWRNMPAQGRCAYTGCWSLEPVEKLVIGVCGHCFRAKYCSQNCQEAHLNSTSWDSHKWTCNLRRSKMLSR